MAPNIQLAGNFAIRSNSALATDAPISPTSPIGEAMLIASVGAEADVIPVSTTRSGSAAVRRIHADRLDHRDGGDVRALLDGENRDLRERPGLAAKKAEVLSQP